MPGGHFIDGLVTVFGFIALVALVAVVVSKNAQTPAVIQAVGTAYGSDLAVAVSPVTGVSTAPNLTYPGGSPFTVNG